MGSSHWQHHEQGSSVQHNEQARRGGAATCRLAVEEAWLLISEDGCCLIYCLFGVSARICMWSLSPNCGMHL